MSNSISVSDLANFDQLIAPRVLKIVYWIGLAGIGIFALISFVGALGMLQFSAVSAIGTMLLAVVGFGFAVLFWRILIEVQLILFKIYERLGEIRDNGRPIRP